MIRFKIYFEAKTIALASSLNVNYKKSKVLRMTIMFLAKSLGKNKVSVNQLGEY